MKWVYAAVAAAVIAAFSVRGEQVMLLDTTTEQTLGWTRYPYGPHASSPGWHEESYTNFENNINWRSYVVCDVAHHNVNNWLWTPFIDRRNANRIYIEMKFTIRPCDLFPGNALSCKETFSLLYHECDEATREPPPWDDHRSYKLVGRIAAGEGRFNTILEGDINTEVKSIAVTKRGVFIAFRDQGACISIMAVKVYYITCSEVTINFAKFPATPTGREVTVSEQVNGTCVQHSETAYGESAPIYLCKGDGKWTLPSGSCKCSAGYEPDRTNQICNECTPGKFKSHTGDEHCIPCPDYSKSTAYASEECKCIPGFFRAKNDSKNVPCTKTPSTSGNAPNGVTDLTSEPPKKVEITVVTETSVVSVITKLRVVSADSDKLSLAWNPPPIDLTDPDDIIESYEVKCFPKNNLEKIANATVRITKEPHITISGLKRDTEYGIRVTAKMKSGWGELSAIIYGRTSFVGEKEGALVRLVAGVMVAVVIISVIAIVCFILPKQPCDCNTLNY